jgi:hypothetical protein
VLMSYIEQPLRCPEHMLTGNGESSRGPIVDETCLFAMRQIRPGLLA